MYKDQIYYFLIICSLFLSLVHIYPKSKIASACFSLMMISGLTGIYHPLFLNPWMNEQNGGTIADICLHTTLFTFCSWTLIFTLTKDGVKKLIEIISLICIINSAYLFYKWSNGLRADGMLLNTSNEGTFLAIMIPIILFKKDQLKIFHKSNYLSFLLLAPIVAVFITTSSMGICGFALGMGAYYFAKNTSKGLIKTSLIVFLIGIIGCFLGYLKVGNALFNDSLRYVCWKWSFDWWFENGNKLIGTGLGSFWGLGPYIQILKGYQIGNYYTFMHSDILQTVFEMGMVGLILMAIAIYKCVEKTFNRPWLWSTVVVCLSQLMFNEGVRYILSAIIMLAIFRVALEEENVS